MRTTMQTSRRTSRWIWLCFCLTGALMLGAMLLSQNSTRAQVQEKQSGGEEEQTPTLSSRVSDPQAKAPHSYASKPAAPERVAASYTNSTAITITDCPSPCPASGQQASLYPSPITVAGEVGVIQRVSVTLNGLSHTFPSDIDMLLVSPLGRKTVIMSDFGAGAPGVSGINVTLDDYASAPVPSTVTGNTGVPFVTNSYRPANSGTTDVFPAAAPASPYQYQMAAFNGDNPNGTWNLYIIDDANLDGGSISGGWTITFDVRPPAPTAGQVLVSEFRARGIGTAPPTSDGGADEFIELYNNTDSNITIIDAIPGADPTSATGAGWRLGGAQGATESTFLVLPETLSTAGPLAIPARGHFLISTQPTTPSPAGNTYSLSTYPTGTGFTASGAANISVNPAVATTGFLADDVGLAVFSTANPLTTNRLDSVGYSSVTNPDYKEGTGLSPATGITTAAQTSWVRKTTQGVPQDTNNNAADFTLIETTGATLNGVAAILGSPGPERGPAATAFTTTDAPIHSVPAPTPNMPSTAVDPTAQTGASPNFERNVCGATGFPACPGTPPFPLGYIALRRTFTNQTGFLITALRFRIVDVTTLNTPNPGGAQADLRPISSTAHTVTTAGGPVTVQATVLQTPPTLTIGGGLNTSLGETVITTTAPLANGASTSVEFLFGINTEGPYHVFIIAEANTTPTDGQGLRGVTGGFSANGCAGSQAVLPCLNLPTAAPADVSGRITTADGAPLAGVTMNLSGARDAKVISDANGNYRFANVSTQNFYTVTPSLRNYHFGPESQSFSLVTNKTDAMFTATRDAVSSGNAMDTADYFVRQHYLDFLGREPDESGFNFWSDQIMSCGSDAGCVERRTINVSAAYFLSIEFQQTGGLVDGLYRASYGRAPLYAEFMPDTGMVAHGVVVGSNSHWAQTLEANKQAFVEAWMQRSDFRASYDGLGNSAFVDTLIDHAGAGFSGNRNALLSGLNGGSLTRAAVLRQVVENEGFVHAKSNQMFVMMEYFGYLRRDPDAGGYGYWLNKLNQFEGNFEQAEMVKAFINSGEYRARFQQ